MRLVQRNIKIGLPIGQKGGRPVKEMIQMPDSSPLFQFDDMTLRQVPA